MEPQEDHIFLALFSLEYGRSGIPGSRNSSVGTVTVLRARRTRNRVRIVGGSKVIFLLSRKSSATVGFTLCCIEMEEKEFLPEMHLASYTWQLTVALFQGRSVSAVRLLSVMFFKGRIPLYILTDEELVYSVISAIIFCFTDAYKGVLLLLLCLEKKVTHKYVKTELRKISPGTNLSPKERMHFRFLDY